MNCWWYYKELEYFAVKSCPNSQIFILSLQDNILNLAFFTDVPKLPPLPRPGEDNEDEDDEEESKEDKPKKQRKLSGPKAINPYANDESSMLIPIAVAIAVFLPTLFCLCKLW